jgi:LCP family protein required for cell wall assembly
VTGPTDQTGAGGDPPRRSLPPELDPRRPVQRRRAAPKPAAAASTTPAGDAPGSPPGDGLPPGQHRRWGPRFIRSWTRRRLLGTVAGVMAFVLIATGGFIWYEVNDIFGHIHHRNCPTTICANAGKGLNILLMGSDSRHGLTAEQKKALHVGHDSGRRSDTLILVHIPANGGKADMVSLPRDSYVTIPAHCPGGRPPRHNKCPKGASVVPAAQNKLNAAYSFGGPLLAMRTVEANTHVPINHYIIINFLGFVNMVDKLGGVPICSPKAISDPVRPDPANPGHYMGSGLELPAGTSTLHGAQALEYVRAREFDPSQGDLGRIQRQQKFMGAMLGKAESAGVILNIPKLLGFLKAVADSLTVDSGLGKGTMFSLARRLHSMSPRNVNLFTVPLSNTNLSTSVGSAVQWDPALSKKLFHDFRSDTPITDVIGKHQKLTVAPSSISLKVLNATNKNGLASKAAQDLAGVGFPTPSTGNAPKGSDPSKTVVVYGPARADSAKTVAAAVPGSTTQQDNSLGSGIELLVGSNYSGVKSVKVSTPSSNRPTVRTGATNPCS